MKVLVTFKTKERIQSDLISSFPDVQFIWKHSIEEAKEEVASAEILVTYGSDLDEDIIERANSLKWIMVLSAGLDDMPLEKINEKNIQVTNSRGISARPMGEYAISMILQVERNAKQLYESEKEKHWDRSVKMEEISEKTMLIAGTGAIGQEVARLAKAFNIKTIGISRSGEPKDHFDEVYTNEHLIRQIPNADYVINILPATKETERMFDESAFQAMKKEAIFLNMGRGTTVNESSLIDALKAGELRHAILDVTEVEPLDSNSPLWTMEETTITPHISGISRHYQPRGFEIFKENLEAYLKGEPFPLNEIDVTRGY